MNRVLRSRPGSAIAQGDGRLEEEEVWGGEVVCLGDRNQVQVELLVRLSKSRLALLLTERPNIDEEPSGLEADVV